MNLTPTIPCLDSFEEYCTYNDGSDNRYEWVDGRLELVNPPTFRHLLISKYLERVFDGEIEKRNLPLICLRAAGIRTGWRKSRLADLYIIPQEAAMELLDKTAIVESAPLLVVEVVSPDSVTRDYRYKRSEYAALEIPEYWIVDSITNQVTVLLFEEGLYEERIFTGEETIISRLFCQLDLKVNQIFNTGYLG